MRDYELVVLVSDGAQGEKALEEVQSAVLKIKGTVGNVADWGVKPLSYPIKKQTQAHYFLLTVSTEGETIGTLNRSLQINDHIVRHLIVTKESEGVQNAPKTSKAKEAPTPKKRTKTTKSKKQKGGE